MARTLIDLNDIVADIGMAAATIFKYSTNTNITVIGDAELTILVRETLIDSVNNRVGINSPNLAESISDNIYIKMLALKRTVDPSLLGLGVWYDFVDFHISIPIESIVNEHLSKYGVVSGCEPLVTACKNIWFIY